MRRYYIILSTLLFLCLAMAGNASAKVQKGQFYMFGVAASFLDSVAYVTDVHPVEGITYDSKTKFIMDRNLYSAQLQKHMEQEHGKTNLLTAVFYDRNKSKLEKKLLSISRKYAKTGSLRLQTIGMHFTAEEWVEPVVVEGGSKKQSQSKGLMSKLRKKKK